MRDESAFDGAEFLGPARRARRDPYRLALFAQHLEVDERANAVLPIGGGTLVVTDRRLLELRPHLEVDGAWNVREFSGYTVSRELPLSAVTEATHLSGRQRSTQPSTVEDVLRIQTSKGTEDFVLSRGPEAVVPAEDVARVIALLTRNSPSRDPGA